jgi:hypothetical protein
MPTNIVATPKHEIVIKMKFAISPISNFKECIRTNVAITAKEIKNGSNKDAPNLFQLRGIRRKVEAMFIIIFIK